MSFMLAGEIALLIVLLSVVEGFEPRSYNGTGNNLAETSWGSVGSTQIRAVAGGDYDDDDFTPPGSDRPTAREVMTDVFLSSTPAVSGKSALFVAWGQMLTFDLSLTADNSSEAFDVPCDDGGGLVDVWCPLGASSDDISFNRSEAEVVDSVRNPINYATAFIDLDYLYGRSEDEAGALRTFEGGLMNVTESGVPFRNEDGTWLMADQRPATYPVTFALHIILLLEHNRCCVDVAPDLGYEGDEDLYQACRAWTIAVFQHVTENDFDILLLGSSILDTFDDTSDRRRRTRNRRRLNSEDRTLTHESDRSDRTENHDRKEQVIAATVVGRTGTTDDVLPPSKRLLRTSGREKTEATLVGEVSSATASRRSLEKRRLYSADDYDEDADPSVDVFTLTAGAAALESALPATVRIVAEDYISVDDDNIELTVATEDIAGLFERNDVGNILRGAVLSPALAVDTYYVAAVSNLSPFFKLPVDGVQRGRDHGLPAYNDAREAYNLTAVTDFSGVTSDDDLSALLSAAYDGDIDTLDAITGALAEDTLSAGGIFGELLHEAWAEQLFRTYAGDRLHHLHSRDIEDAEGTTLSAVIERTVNVTDLPLAAFSTPGITVCGNDCESTAEGSATLSDSFAIAWDEIDDDMIEISMLAKDIGSEGMLGIGFGGSTMYTAEDYIVCVVTSEDEAECSDRSSVSSRETPDLDDEDDPYFEVTDIVVGTEWTTVTFIRERSPVDEDDYDLGQDIDDGSTSTSIIYAFKEGDIGQHSNANRGSASVNFATGDSVADCDDDSQFVSLHGALMLLAWMLFAPLGIYFIRYRKGENVEWAGREWWEMHEEIMIVSSEAVLPLGITAVFASGGDHDTSHAHWGYYLIAAVALQVFSGWIRTKALEAKHANFSYFHRVNKYFHIYSGRFAYVAGVVQCYRGLELVSDDDNLIFEAGDGLDLQLGNFGWTKDYVFPTWLGLLGLCFLFFETRKQYHRYFKKGSAYIFGVVQLINERHDAKGRDTGERLIPRTEDLPIFTLAEFNDKVFNGQNWVLVDGAVLDVAGFAHRHPGGARLILNALGTDVTEELLGEEQSVGHAMMFTPHTHPESAWELARSLVIAYIEEDDEEEEEAERDSKMAKAPAPAEPSVRVAIAPFGKGVLLAGRLARPGGTPQPSKGSSLNDLVALPEGAAPSAEPQAQDEPARGLPTRWGSSHKRLLERFHVCPLLFREVMGVSSAVGRGNLRPSRPVYRYIFSCPGQAQALVKAITGAGYFNLRATRGAQGVIQRPYNAFAVRVLDSEPPEPGRSSTRGGGLGVGTRKVVPATQTNEGALCIEMRIKLYPYGAMSKVLDKLANDPDNPAVQLQGPFLIPKLIPPPAHRNVVMIAAGTGVNPMVQQIRDYIARNRDAAPTSRSRLVLLWQAMSEADLFGFAEITAMQAESNGMLEVTALITGDHRRRNTPGVAFRRAKETINAAARQMVSPVWPSPASSIIAMLPSRLGRTSSRDGSQSSRHSRDVDPSTNVGEGKHDEISRSKNTSQHVPKGSVVRPAIPGEAKTQSLLWPGASDDSSGRGSGHQRVEKSTRQRPRESHGPSRALVTRSSFAGSSVDETRRLGHGKVSREILEQLFGDDVMAALRQYNDLSNSLLTSMRKGFDKRPGQKKTWSEIEGEIDDDALEDGLDDLCGSDNTAGKLQVVVSGPSQFVAHVERILLEMGVPSGAMVLLD